jgi:hypothetical protein
VQTPTDIFPSINIPVVSVVWTYSGLLPRDMSDRVIYYYERQLTSQVNAIEHVESQSLNGYGVVKIFFQKGVDIGAALAQVTAVSQTVLKLLPAGITPPYVLNYNASSVPILNLVLSSKKLPQDRLFDLGQNFIRSQPSTARPCHRPMGAKFSRRRSTSTSRRCNRTMYRPTISSTRSRRKTWCFRPAPRSIPPLNGHHRLNSVTAARQDNFKQKRIIRRTH